MTIILSSNDSRYHGKPDFCIRVFERGSYRWKICIWGINHNKSRYYFFRAFLKNCQIAAYIVSDCLLFRRCYLTYIIIFFWFIVVVSSFWQRFTFNCLISVIYLFFFSFLSFTFSFWLFFLSCKSEGAWEWCRSFWVRVREEKLQAKWKIWKKNSQKKFS